MIEKNKYYIIDITKLFLLLGVVSIHCDVLASESCIIHAFGSEVVVLLSSTLTKICVPAFFILSGFLFFQNQDKFNLQIYKSKLHRRIYTLLIPYILWNIISLILHIIKIKYLGFPDHGLFENGNIQWLKVFEGFYDYTDGYPFAFAFWFIRNLIVFVILSPLVYLIGCKKLSIGIVFIIACCLINTTLWGFSFFVIGGIIARYFKNFIFKIPFWPAFACGFIWFGIAMINVRWQFEYLASTILIIESIFALIFITSFIRMGRMWPGKSLISKIAPATFFIYSFHQLYCSVVRNFYIKVFGLDTSIGIVLSYFLSFITLVGFSYIVWLVLKSTCPSILNVLCGNRGNYTLNDEAIDIDKSNL